MVGGRKLRKVNIVVLSALFAVLGRSAVAAADAVATAPVDLAFTDRCPDLDRPRPRDPAARRRAVVTAAYCGVLRRAPDSPGLAYWVEQLERGVTPVGLIEQLVASDEYRARSVRTFRQSFAALGSGRASAAMSPGPAAAAPMARPDPIRVRRPISAKRFTAWVAERGLGSVDRITPALVHGRLDGDRQRINVVYVHLSASRGVRVSPGDRPRSAVGTWAEEIGAHVAINGNWYEPYDGPAVSGGEVYGGEDHGYTALIGFTARGDAVVDHHREVNASVDRRVVERVAGHPTLVHRGERTTDFGGDPTFTARHPRTAIGLDRSGDVLILVTVDGRRPGARGMTGAETATLLERLGSHDAVMLDGGGSTTMWLAGRGIVSRPSGRPRAVGNQVAVFGD